MAEVGLQSARIVPLIGQRVATRVPEHMGVRLETQLGLPACPFHHACEACRAEGRTALGGEHKGRLGLLFALEPP